MKPKDKLKQSNVIQFCENLGATHVQVLTMMKLASQKSSVSRSLVQNDIGGTEMAETV